MIVGKLETLGIP